MKNTTAPSAAALGLKVPAAIACRLVLNTARRFAYPFAPVLSRGLEVPLTAVTSMIAVNQATAVIGMLSGPLADRLGYRLMMLAGLAMLTVGMSAAGVLPIYAVVLAALFLAGLGKSVFDPALQAYISARVPYERRGLVIGLLEVSWAGSTLVGIPLIAILIDRFGWRSPFFAMGGLGLLGFVAIARLVTPEERVPAGFRPKVSFRQAWGALIEARAARGILGYVFLVSAANDNLFVVYGAWLEGSFDLSIVALGLGTGIIGAAELAGEGLTALWSDRLGLKHALIGGLVLATFSYLLLPIIARSFALALLSLFLLFLAFEFMMVTGISLSTEVLPGARATMMSGFFAAAGVGRVVGALVGGQVWLSGGIAATCLVSAAINALGLACLLWGLKGWRSS